MSSTQISIDAELVLQYGWPIVFGIIGWFTFRLIRQYDGHATEITAIKDRAHVDRLEAAEKFAKRDDLKTLRDEIRADFARIDNKLDDHFGALIRELRK